MKHAILPLAVIVTLAATQLSDAAVLVDLNPDFSNAAQGINGLEYGSYTQANATTGTFSTAGWVPSFDGWYGGGALGTPFQDANRMHATYPTMQPAVRRYTIGAGGEPAYSGWVEIVGNFYDLNPGGSTSGFVTVNGINLFDMIVPDTEPSAVNFDIFVLVAPGSTVDFGQKPAASGPGSDGTSNMTGITATVSTTTNVPEPASIVFAAIGILGIVSRRIRNGRNA
jgi:hypothetical protein